MSSPITHRIMGGSPLAVSVRLVLVSLLVGALMSWMEIDPLALLDWMQVSLMRLWAEGFRSLHQVGRYVLTGAAVVVPVWLLLRLTSIGYRDPRPARPGRWDLPGAPESERERGDVRSEPRG